MSRMGQCLCIDTLCFDTSLNGMELWNGLAYRRACKIGADLGSLLDEVKHRGGPL